MAEITEIKSLDDKALDPYARLTEHQLKNKKRPEDGVFIAESETAISLALDAGIKPVSFLAQRSQLKGAAAKTFERCPGVPVYTADDEILKELTGFELSRGLLSVMKRPFLPTPEEVCRGALRIAVLENTADSTNVGTIMRSAAALGLDGILITPSCSDPLLRRSVRVSMGTVFQIPWTYIGDKDRKWPEYGMKWLRDNGFTTAATALKEDTIPIDDPILKETEKLAVILGTEGCGLMKETISLSDYTIKIPMYHGVDSLNVACAATITFWETRKTKR